MKNLILALWVGIAASCGGVIDQSVFVEPVQQEVSTMGTGAWAKTQLAAGAHVANTAWDLGCWIYQEGGINKYGDGWIGIPHGTRFRAAISDTSTGWIVVA